MWEDAWTNDSSRGPGPGSNNTPSTLVSASLRRFNSIDISSYVDPANNTHGKLYRTQRLTVSPKHPGSYLFYIIPLHVMIAYTQSLPSVFVKQLHTKARIRTKAGGCGVEPHTQTAFGSLLPPRGATQKLCAPVRNDNKALY